MVSHELRTPLTAIRSFSEILCDHPDVELDQRMSFLGVINKESRRLIRMINDLLDFAKIEAGKIDWLITKLDPKALVEAAAASVTPMFEEKHIDLTLEMPAQTPTIKGDVDRLSQVLISLLSSAHKFAPEGAGQVRVSLAVGPRDITVSVADNGPGIPPEQCDEIFAEFHQGTYENGSHPPGTGLGLAICRRIVDHLGGRIWMESVPGQGATFRFTLPVCGAPVGKPERN